MVTFFSGWGWSHAPAPARIAAVKNTSRRRDSIWLPLTSDPALLRDRVRRASYAVSAIPGPLAPRRMYDISARSVSEKCEHAPSTTLSDPVHLKRPETTAPANICERRDTRESRETASQRRNPPQVTDLRQSTNRTRRRGFPRRRAVRGSSSFWPSLRHLTKSY